MSNATTGRSWTPPHSQMHAGGQGGPPGSLPRQADRPIPSRSLTVDADNNSRDAGPGPAMSRSEDLNHTRRFDGSPPPRPSSSSSHASASSNSSSHRPPPTSSAGTTASSTTLVSTYVSISSPGSFSIVQLSCPAPATHVDVPCKALLFVH